MDCLLDCCWFVTAFCGLCHSDRSCRKRAEIFCRARVAAFFAFGSTFKTASSAAGRAATREDYSHLLQCLPPYQCAATRPSSHSCVERSPTSNA